MHRSKNFVICFVPSATPGGFDAVKSHPVRMCSIFARLLGLIGNASQNVRYGQNYIAACGRLDFFR
jgi:hypothetical protein